MGTVSLGLERITKRFGSVTAVQDFSLKVEEGEFVSLLGPSGCGKTTILRCIAGFERPDTGQVYLYGQVVNDVPPERRDVGMVFQAYALFPNMTVGQNIAFPLMIKGSPKVEQRQRVAELLHLSLHLRRLRPLCHRRRLRPPFPLARWKNWRRRQKPREA